MAIQQLDVVTRDEHGVLHRRFRAPDGALIGTHRCPAFGAEMQIGADAWSVVGDVDPDALCPICFVSDVP